MRALKPAELDLADRQMTFLENFFNAVFERRRTTPRDDLATVLINARDGDSQLTAREIVTVAIGLFGAGFETTAHMIGNAVLCFSRFPDQWRKLVADPTLAAKATEEVLRFEPSLLATYRTAFNDVEVGGKTIDAIDALEEHVIRTVVDRIPDTFLPAGRKSVAIDGLLRRRQALRSSFDPQNGGKS